MDVYSISEVFPIPFFLILYHLPKHQCTVTDLPDLPNCDSKWFTDNPLKTTNFSLCELNLKLYLEGVDLQTGKTDICTLTNPQLSPVPKTGKSTSKCSKRVLSAASKPDSSDEPSSDATCRDDILEQYLRGKRKLVEADYDYCKTPEADYVAFSKGKKDEACEVPNNAVLPPAAKRARTCSGDVPNDLPICTASTICLGKQKDAMLIPQGSPKCGVPEEELPDDILLLICDSDTRKASESANLPSTCSAAAVASWLLDTSGLRPPKVCVTSKSIITATADGGECTLSTKALPKSVISTIPICVTGSKTSRFDTSQIVSCPQGSHSSLSIGTKLLCTLNNDYYLWNIHVDDAKFCQLDEKDAKSLPEDDEVTVCGEVPAIVKFVNTLNALSSRVIVNPFFIKECTFQEMASANGGDSKTCVFDRMFYVWTFGKSRKSDICIRPNQKNSKSLQRWVYCPEEAVNLLDAATEEEEAKVQPDQVEEASASFELVGPPLGENSTTSLEDDLRAFVVQSFLPRVSVSGFLFTDLVSRKARSKHSNTRILLRHLMQTSSRILAQFTVQVRSIDVVGMDFAATLGKRLKKNARKFDGGGKYTLDPDSIQVTSGTPSSQLGSNNTRNTFWALFAGLFILAIFFVGFAGYCTLRKKPQPGMRYVPNETFWQRSYYTERKGSFRDY